MLGRVRGQLPLRTVDNALAGTRQIATPFHESDRPGSERSLWRNPGHDQGLAMVKCTDDTEFGLRQGRERTSPDGCHDVEARIERAGAPLYQCVAGKRGLARFVTPESGASHRLDGDDRLLDGPVVGAYDKHPCSMGPH
jgi:hypothetical protein